MFSNMKAKLLLRQRKVISANAFAELVVWQLPVAASGSGHAFKYRLAFVVDGVCVLRYDNEAGKGDHRHSGKRENPYRFTTPEKLLSDFWNDVEKIK
jgi:hypothetical protein